MEKRYIAAIEIGSSKIKGAIAAIEPETRQVNVLATVTEPLVNSVRYGRVQNVQNVSAAVNEIIRKLENTREVAPRKVTHVYIGLGGRSFTTLSAVGELKLPGELEITADTVERLKREALDDISTAKQVVSIEPRRFFVANQEVKNVIGAFGQNLRGEFTAIVCSPENRLNLDRIRLNAGADDISRTYITHIVALADMVTTRSERQLGCLVLDCGAETTTMAIYKEDTLRFISTLPLGGRNITLDLSRGLSLTEDNAEQIKCTRSTATPDHGHAADATQAAIDNYVGARSGEIIANVQNQIKVAAFKTTDLPAGIILTGGCSRLPGFAHLLEKQTGMKVTMGRVDDLVILSSRQINPNIDLDVIALLRYAANTSAENCLTPAQPQHEAQYTSQRNFIPENDPDILVDDPDPETDDDKHSGSKGGWLSRITKRDKSGGKHHAPQYEEPEYEEPEPEEPEYVDDEPEKPSATIERIKNWGRTMFGSPDDE